MVVIDVNVTDSVDELLIVEAVEDSMIVVDVGKELKLVVELSEVMDDATDVELVILSEVTVDEETWKVSDVEADRDVNDCDMAVDDVIPVVDVVVGVDVELAMLSVVVGGSVKDDETDADSAEDVSTAVVKLGISVDVPMEIGVVTTVETGGAEPVEEIIGTFSVGV